MKQVGNVGGICMKIRKNRGTWRDWRKIMDVRSSHLLYMIVGRADEQALLATMEVREKLCEIGVGTNLPIVERVSPLLHYWASD